MIYIIYIFCFLVYEGPDLKPFVELMSLCAGNPIMKIRELAAKAVVPFLPASDIPQEISWRLQVLQKENGVRNNFRHGLLLQVSRMASPVLARVL